MTKAFSWIEREKKGEGENGPREEWMEKDVIVNHSRVPLNLEFFSRVNERHVPRPLSRKIDDAGRPRTFRFSPFFID